MIVNSSSTKPTILCREREREIDLATSKTWEAKDYKGSLSSTSKVGSLAKISGDLDANKEHTHDISEDHRRDPGRGEGRLHALGPILVQGEVHEHDADPAEDEHEAGGEALDDVLAVDPAGHEDDGADGPGEGVLSGADAGGLHDDVVDDPGDDHEVGEEDEGVDGHRGGEGEGGQLQAEARRPEEGERQDL